MYKSAFYIGEEKENSYKGVVAEDNLFLVVEIEEGTSTVLGREFTKYLKGKILENLPNKLSELDGLISNSIKEKNLPPTLSMSVGLINNGILYLKTVGGGRIIIKRKDKVVTLLQGDNSASGYFEPDDIYVFTMGKFIETLGGDIEFKNIFDHKDPIKIVEDITPILKSKDDSNLVALFIGISPVDLPVEVGEFKESENIYSKLTEYYNSLKVSSYGNKKRTLTFITVFIIFIIFIWSVVLGYGRRTTKEATTSISSAKSLIAQKLTTAEEVAFLNLSRAQVLLTESREALTDLQKKYPKNNGVAEIKEMIDTTENKILKKEDRKFSEFFDLAVEDKKAGGSQLYLNEESLYILDKNQGVLYNLSLEKKSLTKDSIKELKSADLIGSYEDDRYFYVKGIGIFTITSDGKAKKIVEQDKKWGEITDMALFNANIYLMDKGNDEIYKYVKIEEGFGGGASYFASGQ